MRKYGYLLALAAAGILGAACNDTGFDGSWAGYNGGSNNANGAATLAEITVAVTEDGGASWWAPESKSRYNQCHPQLIQTLYHRIPSSMGIFGRYFDTGEIDSFPSGDIYSTTQDTNGDGWINGPSNAQVGAGAGGYTSAVAFYAYCDNGAPADIPFDDEIAVRSITPINGYYSTGLTDNLSFFMLPGYNNDSNTHKLDAMDRLPLATRLEILKTIDTSKDIVRVPMPNGHFREDVRLHLTSLTVDGQTFVPSDDVNVVVTGFHAFKFDPADPATKPLAEWLANRLDEAFRAGTNPTGSLVLNGSMTINSSDVASLFPNMTYTYSKELMVDRLREYAGVSPVSGDGGREFDGRDR